MTKESKKLGENFKKFRIEKGLSQSDVADSLGISRGFISNIESGKKNPTLITLTKLANSVGISIDKLLK
ncbi:helix-turn-helix transcriptional regulator [Candidatus Nomurabacteria bacterium]|nr:helix-turn-helix transcriptional regulator [Candidatus Nomurabacteria bacterium]